MVEKKRSKYTTRKGALGTERSCLQQQSRKGTIKKKNYIEGGVLFYFKHAVSAAVGEETVDGLGAVERV